MGKEITTQDLENLEYRKKRLHRKLEQLEQLLSGGGSSLRALVRGDHGKWSEDCGRSVVQALLEALDLGLRGGMEPAEAPCPLSQLPPVLTQEQRALFESFFYCALRVLDAPVPGPTGLGQGSGTWTELLLLAKETMYSDRHTLYFDELYRDAAGFFGVMDQVYEALTGAAAVCQTSAMDIQIMRERFQTELAEQDLHSAWEELPGEAKMEFSEPFTAFDQAAEEEQAAALANWRDSFPEKEQFCQKYLRFRELYFTTGAWRHLAVWTERAVDLYLYREGTSSFLTDGRYFLAYGLLDRSERQLRTAVWEAG